MVATRARTTRFVCGFCKTGNHEKCPRGVRNGDGKVVTCKCDAPWCGGTVLRCLDCKTEEEGTVSPDDWRCLDRDACGVRVQIRLDANPVIQKIRERERVMAETTGTEKAEKAPKSKEPTYCLHCGEQTKGGKFHPGHDAALVSTAVKSVTQEGTTEDSVLKDFQARGVSEPLQKKFVKSVKLAREAEQKRAEAAKAKEEAARAAAEAKAAKEAAEAEAESAKETVDA